MHASQSSSRATGAITIEWVQDRYAIAQVALYIQALVLGIETLMRFTLLFADVPAGTADAQVYRIHTLAIPALQSALLMCGAVVLAQRLGACTRLVWRIALVVMGAQALVCVLSMAALFNVMSLVSLVLAVCGLASLLIQPLPRLPEPTRRYPDEASTAQVIQPRQ